MQTKKIVWEKWRDPFIGYDENDVDIDHERDIIDNYIDHVNENDPEKNLNTVHNNEGIKVISTPMGLIPYNEYTASSKIFNFWTGHTNFNLSESIVNILQNTDGVETLDIFTRYRFRLGIGKVFDETSVKQQIWDNINDYFKKQ